MNKLSYIFLTAILGVAFAFATPISTYATEETTEATTEETTEEATTEEITTGYYDGLYYVDGTLAKGLTLVDGYYYFFKKGVLQTTGKWCKSGKYYYYVGSKNRVTYKFNKKVCYKIKKKKITLLKSSHIDFKGTLYYFDSKGALMEGFNTVDGDYYYFKKGIYITNTYKQIGKYYYYFGEDGKAVKSDWVTYKKQELYFNAKGRCTKIFYKTNYKKKSYRGKLKIYKSGKWKFVKKGLYNINGTYRYFASSSLCITTGWYEKSSSVFLYVVSGEVQYKLTYKNSVYKLYYANKGKWSRAKNIWMPVKSGMTIYFDASGNMLYRYMNSDYATKSYRQTYWVYTTKWTRQKSAFVEMEGYYYYADSDGYLYMTEGWHALSETSSVYTESDGKVSAYIYYDEELLSYVYKTGYDLATAEAGAYEALINGNTVYVNIGEDGTSVAGDGETSVTVDGYIYTFDENGLATSRLRDGGIVIDSDAWFKRVLATYLGKTGYACNEFVYYALAMAGGDDSTVANALKYTSASEGGIKLSSAYNSTAWGGGSVVYGTLTLSDGTTWKESETIQINENITDFSYDDLHVGDVIVYYKTGETSANHVAIYIGQFESATALKTYLVSLGVSSANAESYVKTWGTSYNNESTHWVIHGGMGSSKQIYISNTAYCIPVSSSGDYEYAKKIVHVFD